MVYHGLWLEFDNATHSDRFLGTSRSASPDMRAPAPLPTSEGAYVKVELSSTSAEHASWLTPVHAYFRLHGGAWRLVGFERMPSPRQPSTVR